MIPATSSVFSVILVKYRDLLPFVFTATWGLGGDDEKCQDHANLCRKQATSAVSNGGLVGFFLAI
jgi:hypothetical protein